ncbi:MAG: DUF3822 family protein [Flavobacteriales bacterium]
MTENEVKNYANFHLSIELNSTEIHFLLVDKSTKKAVAIESLSLDEKKINKSFLQESEILTKSSPDSVSCVIQNSLLALVPNSMFQEGESQTYLGFNSNSLESIETKSDKLIKHEITSCYGLDKETQILFSSVFPSIQFKHISSILVDSLSDGFHINFSAKNEFEITVIENKKLLFFNRFIAENTDETLYYVSLVAEKLKLNIQRVNLNLSGMISPKDETFLFFSQFIPSENLNFNEIEASQLNAISTHRFFTLHKQIQCV